MKWTKTKPTTPGWWWMRQRTGIWIVRLFDLHTANGEWHLFIGRDGLDVEVVDAEWSSSPIPEPEEEKP